MGLILSKLLIEQYGGMLNCASQANIGTTFAFSFEINVFEENNRRVSRRRPDSSGSQRSQCSPKFGMDLARTMQQVKINATGTVNTGGMSFAFDPENNSSEDTIEHNHQEFVLDHSPSELLSS